MSQLSAVLTSRIQVSYFGGNCVSCPSVYLCASSETLTYSGIGKDDKKGFYVVFVILPETELVLKMCSRQSRTHADVENRVLMTLRTIVLDSGSVVKVLL